MPFEKKYLTEITLGWNLFPTNLRIAERKSILQKLNVWDFSGLEIGSQIWVTRNWLLFAHIRDNSYYLNLILSILHSNVFST